MPLGAGMDMIQPIIDQMLWLGLFCLVGRYGWRPPPPE